MTDTKTKAPTVEQIMMQAQVFASAWANTDSPFDYEGSYADAERERDKLRALVNASLAQQSARRTELVEAQDRAIAALLDFASTVAGGASWWDDVWPEHEAALDAARKGEQQ